jgi:hypothetical protein
MLILASYIHLMNYMFLRTKKNCSLSLSLYMSKTNLAKFITHTLISSYTITTCKPNAKIINYILQKPL